MNRTPLRLCAWTATCVLLSASVGGASADPRDPLAELWAADDLSLAQAAERLGAEPVLTRLRGDSDPAVTLAAVRIAPFLRGPEVVLGPLIRLAAGRDPDLSEAAARCVRQIVQAETLRSGGGGAVAVEVWRAARLALSELAKDSTLRPDLKQQVLESVALLGAIAG